MVLIKKIDETALELILVDYNKKQTKYGVKSAMDLHWFQFVRAL